MTEITALHAIIAGRVQGVGFRYFVAEAAQKLELTGWVRNQDSGDVEVVAEGTRPALDLFLLQLERGPRAAFVSQVTISWENASGEHPTFSIAPTSW